MLGYSINSITTVPGVRKARSPLCPLPSLNEIELATNEYNDLYSNPYVVGDEVFLRSSGRCDDPWSGPHRITSIQSTVSVEIDNDAVRTMISGPFPLSFDTL